MKKKLVSVVFVLLFFIFTGIMDYPFLMRLYNERVQGNVVVNYDEAASDTGEVEKEKMLADARAYNEKLANDSGVDIVIPFENKGKQDSEYMNLLNASENGVMGIIRIPKIDVSLPIYHGTSENELQKGAGHLEGSSLPVGGESIHSCISAHRGLPTSKMFTNLDLIENGDVFYIDVLRETLAYQVYKIETVTPDNVEPLIIRDGEDLVTLITCTPYGINTHRIYVHAQRIPYEGPQKEEKIDITSKGFWINYWWIPVTIVLFLWMIFMLYMFNRKPKKKVNYFEDI